MPVRPRPTATRRDRKLRLSGFIHLSFTAQTPLLSDKRTRGFPHAMIAFDAALAEEPNAAYLPYNAKSWRHRDDFAPIREAMGKAEFLAKWQRGRYPSAELLIETALPLAPHARGVHLASAAEEVWLRALMSTCDLVSPVPITVSPELFPAGPEPDLAPYTAYSADCAVARGLLAPPDLPFD